MKLNKIGKGQNIKWILSTDEDYECRHCGKKEFIEGYYCPADNKISCIGCKELENNMDHSEKYLTGARSKISHEIFRVEIKKEIKNGSKTS